MELENPTKKQVTVTLKYQDYIRLSRLAAESGRTRPGYLRWLLYRHFDTLKNQTRPS